ncbi:ATP-binding cassette domain-containing protein [Jonesia quinghaiensis]|uniref:ATP-binding cassette domain-containing protein n=1 Tax=Jonesia quinghaiensis TaxID=262806 RepID=UPI0003FC4FBC|nr:ATP-binding cassette domain-containing protein [Jonesia quinghaiensis]
MAQPTDITISHVTKQFGSALAVDDLSFTVPAGKVTGFLGPNGSGKTTTLRILLGLVSATSGEATFAGTPYKELTTPLATVGASLEATSFHPGRTAFHHLRSYAPLAGATDDRCRELIALVGLQDAMNQRIGQFSLGMRQRLALATALLGDPDYLLLDEPANGLDPAGIRWLRGFLRDLAAHGKTVLVSSHMLSEVQHSVDEVVVISRGRLRHQSPVGDLHALSVPRVQVITPDVEKLRRITQHNGWSIVSEQPVHESTHAVVFEGTNPQEVGEACFVAGIMLHELMDLTESLEDVFLRLTEGVA